MPHPAHLFLQGLVTLFSLPLKSLFVAPLVGDFLLGLGSDEPERRTLGQSLARTDKFISAVKLFYRSRNKELKYMVSRVHTELTHNQYKHFKDSAL